MDNEEFIIINLFYLKISKLGKWIYRQSPTYDDLTYNFFLPYNDLKAIRTQQKLYFEFRIFIMFWYDTLLWCWVSTAPSQAYDHEGKPTIYLPLFCTHTSILFVTFSTVFKKLHEILNINDINFVVDYFA